MRLSERTLAILTLAGDQKACLVLGQGLRFKDSNTWYVGEAWFKGGKLEYKG